MGGACDMYGEKRNAYRVLVGNLKEREHLEELDVGITSKWVLTNRMRGCGLVSSGSQCQATGSCEHSNDS